jgi:hypothetical protein
MQIEMRNAAELPPERIAEFLRASQSIEFAGKSRGAVYTWIQD